LKLFFALDLFHSRDPRSLFLGLSLVEARQQHRKNWVVVAGAADGGILLLLQLLWFGRIITPALDYELDLARQMRRRNHVGALHCDNFDGDCITSSGTLLFSGWRIS
jgi:hypothetical protein